MGLFDDDQGGDVGACGVQGRELLGKQGGFDIEVELFGELLGQGWYLAGGGNDQESARGWCGGCRGLVDQSLHGSYFDALKRGL